MKILDKIRALPLGTRKNIVWGVVVAVGVFLSFFWIRNMQKALIQFEKGREEVEERLKVPDFEAIKFEMPELTDEQKEDFKKIIEEVEKEMGGEQKEDFKKIIEEVEKEMGREQKEITETESEEKPAQQ